jgi:hypothetical protein
MLSTPRAEVLLQQARERRATEQQQQQEGQQHQQQPHGQQEREGSGGGRAAVGRQQQQSRGGVFGLADRDAVHNPLFEGEGDGEKPHDAPLPAIKPLAGGIMPTEQTPHMETM